MSLISAKPSLDAPQFFDAPAHGEGGMVPRMLALASAMRVIDPSLGANLRAYKRTSEGRPHEGEWRWVLTHDGRSVPRSGVMDDERAVDFFEALEKTMPATADRETAHLRIRAGGTGAALPTRMVEEGHRSAALDIKSTRLSDMEDAYAITTPLRIQETAFMRFPDLAQAAMMSVAPALPDADVNSEIPSVRLRARLQRARATLAQDIEKTSPSMRQALLEDIAALDASSSPGQTFEESFHHGWLAYAYANSAKGWETFLAEKAGCSPFAQYAGVSPLPLAIANNDAVGVRAIVESGGSANALMREWPQMFAEREQQELDAAGGSPVTPLMLAARLGKTAALIELLGQGGIVSLANDKGETALHFAAQAGSDTCIRALLAAGADPAATTQEGLLPSDCVPNSPLFRLVRDALEAAANKVAPSPPPAQAPTLASAMRRTAKPGSAPQPQATADPSLWRARHRRTN